MIPGVHPVEQDEADETMTDVDHPKETTDEALQEMTEEDHPERVTGGDLEMIAGVQEEGEVVEEGEASITRNQIGDNDRPLNYQNMKSQNLQ